MKTKNPNPGLNRKPLIYAILLLALMLPTMAGASSSYFSTITNLNPAGYWPMHEVEPAAPGDIETNYGTLGLLGSGFYPDWVNGPGNAVQHQVPGALSGDTDTSVYFGTYNGNSYTNELFIPHTTSLTTLNPPFSVECWFYATNGSSVGNDIWSQNGFEGLNAGPTGGNQGAVGGIRLFGSGSGLTLYTYKPGQNNLGNVSGILPNQWFHLVVTCDAQTNFSVYVNGAAKLANIAAVTKYTPDYWTPFEVGNGRGNTRAESCRVDELAIYTNVLADIGTHYTDGTTGGAGAYFHDVTNDNPVVYLRMDGPSYSPPAQATWPAMANYGSVAGNGVYSPGTMPGAAPGPVNPGNVPFSGVPVNVPQLSGVSSFGDAGNAAAYNPVGPVPFSVTALFRGDPSDGRLQTIVGHSDNSWQISLTTLGKIQCQLGTNTPSQIVSSGVYNDGLWHQLVEVYSPASNPASPGTNSLYVDGVLDTAVSSVTPNGILPGSSQDVMIGSDPQYTNNPAGVGRQFAGQVCDVALFTNALTAAQVRTLFDGTGELLPPFIKTQPLAANNNGLITFSLGVGGTDPLAYQWYSNTSSNYAGAATLTDGGGVSGSTGAKLTVADPTLYYFVTVTNNYGSVTSLVVSAANSTPIFVTQLPQAYDSMWLFPGFNHTFTVSAVGAAPMYYQWFTNGTPMGSPVSSVSPANTSLTLTNVQSAFTNYYCVVTNAFGASTSFVWSASIYAIPSPYAQAVTALNPIGYWRLNEAENGSGDAGVVCHDYVGGNDGVYTNVNLGQQGYNSTADPNDSSVLVGSYNNVDSYGGFIGTNIDFALPSGGSARFSVEAWVMLDPTSTGGIVTKGYSGGGEEFALVTDGNHHFQFLVRTAIAQTVAATTASSTVTPLPSTWYHLVGVCDEANSNLFIYINGTLAGSTNIASGGGITPTTSWPMTIGAQAANQNSDATGYTRQSHGYINDVAVFNYALSPSQVLNEYSQAGITPFFSQQPGNVNVAKGSNAVVSATVYGTLPLAFQWFETNLVAMTAYAINGQTNSSLLIANATTNDNYYLMATNLYGQTNSAPMTLTVYTGPMFTSELPVPYTNSFILFSGSSPAFSVVATSLQNNQPVYYQWFTNGVGKAGATGNSLTLANVQAGSVITNNYCVASNLLGTTTSFVWSASVITAPTNPYPQAVMSLHPIGYWRLDEMDDGLGDNNGGVITHDYAGGNDGIYTNMLLNGPGYSAPASYSASDPNSVPAGFGLAAFTSSDIYGIYGIDFTSPANSSKAFSVEVWVNGYEQQKDAGIVTKGYSGGEQFDLDTGSDGGSPSHAFRFLVRDASGGTHSVNSSVQPNSSWHHLVGVCDEPNGSIIFYIDGQAVGTAAISSSSGILASTAPMTIGSRASSLSALNANNNDLQFVGFINDVTVFNYALSATQVTNEFQGIVSVFVNQNPTNILATLSGNQLTLGWPGDHTGWRLQVQTNSLSTGLRNNWTDVAGSSTTNQVVIPISAVNGSVFYRLIYP